MTDEEEYELVEFLSNSETAYQPPSEYRVFYGFMMLPKKARERVIRAMIAYESVSKE